MVKARYSQRAWHCTAHVAVAWRPCEWSLGELFPRRRFPARPAFISFRTGTVFQSNLVSGTAEAPLWLSHVNLTFDLWCESQSSIVYFRRDRRTTPTWVLKSKAAETTTRTTSVGSNRAQLRKTRASSEVEQFCIVNNSSCMAIVYICFKHPVPCV